MTDSCAFSNRHNCLKWTDYQLTRLELEEADELCHANWIEIQALQKRVRQLEKYLEDHGIAIPEPEDI